MAKSFFKTLVVVENLVKSDEPKLMKDGVMTFYSDDAKSLVTAISNWLLDCNFTKSKTSIFICQNYQKDCEGLTNLWNRTAKKKKSSKTFNCQIATLSSHLYKMLGTDCFDAIIADDKEKMKEIQLRLNLFKEDITFTDYPIEMFQYYVSDNYSGKEYTLDECDKEIKMLKTLRRTALSQYMEQADSDKLSYLRNLLNTPLLNQHTKKVNEKKLALIQRLDTINGTSYADIVVNYLNGKTVPKEKSFAEQVKAKFGMSEEELKQNLVKPSDEEIFERKLKEKFGLTIEQLSDTLADKEIKANESVVESSFTEQLQNNYHITVEELSKMLESRNREKKVLEQYNFMSIVDYILAIGRYNKEEHKGDNLNDDKMEFANEIKVFDKGFLQEVMEQYTSNAVIEGLHELRKEKKENSK